MINRLSEIPIELINQTFSASESIEALSELIDKRINQLKLEHWKAWEKDHSIDRSVYDRKIAELEVQKEYLNELLEDADDSNIKLRLSGSVKRAS